jgi:hypothetical protein
VPCLRSRTSIRTSLMYQVSLLYFLFKCFSFSSQFWIKMHVIKSLSSSVVSHYCIDTCWSPFSGWYNRSVSCLRMLIILSVNTMEITCFTVPAIAYHIHATEWCLSSGTALAWNGSQKLVTLYILLPTLTASQCWQPSLLPFFQQL